MPEIVSSLACEVLPRQLAIQYGIHFCLSVYHSLLLSYYLFGISARGADQTRRCTSRYGVWGNGSDIFNQWGSHGSPSNLPPYMHEICTSSCIETRMYDLAAKTAIELLRGSLSDVPGSRYTAIEPSNIVIDVYNTTQQIIDAKLYKCCTYPYH
jgi:hypothetical protein